MNVENILKVADAIEQASVPGLGFNMNYELQKRDPGDPYAPDQTGHDCGTVACIAGWSCVLSVGLPHANANNAFPTATRYLELDSDTAWKLFMPNSLGNWDGITTAQAVRCLRILAITGKVDWAAAMDTREPVLPSVPAKASTRIATPSVLP